MAHENFQSRNMQFPHHFNNEDVMVFFPNFKLVGHYVTNASNTPCRIPSNIPNWRAPFFPFFPLLACFFLFIRKYVSRRYDSLDLRNTGHDTIFGFFLNYPYKCLTQLRGVLIRLLFLEVKLNSLAAWLKSTNAF